MDVNQGDIYWVALKEVGGAEADGAEANGAEAGYPHPHVVIQADVINHSRVDTVVVCALTTNAKRAKAPGNVRLEAGEANLPRPSIVVVSQVSTVAKAQLGEYIGSLSQERVEQILAGMLFLQRMSAQREREENNEASR
jgi:mRNA interferase MazF